MIESRADLVVLAALPQELQAVWPHLRRVRKGRADGVPYHRGEYAGGTGDLRTAVVGRTGVGPDSASRRVPALLDAHCAGGVLMIGFAGGLDPSLRTADIVVASEGIDLRGEGASGEAGAPPRRRWIADPGGLELLKAISLPEGRGRCVSGSIVTVSRVCSTVEEKAELGGRTGALAVDMESAVVAEECARRRHPFLCVRAILDAADLGLPLDFSGLVTPSGRPRPLRLAGAVARKPRALWGLADLRQRSGRAVESLRAFLAELLHRWPPP